jgi:hypothetical protein
MNGEMKRDGAQQESCTIETDASGLAHSASFPNIKYSILELNLCRTLFRLDAII